MGYFICTDGINWVDALTRSEYKDILVKNLDFCQQNKGLDVFAWCVMTNHVHLIIRAQEGYTLEGILRDYKKFTSKEIIRAIKENPVES
ncbi:MAG: transposase [Paludibacter sp.]|nr:transposase [Paludibacter sp.]